MKAHVFTLAAALALVGWLAPRALAAPQDEGPPPLRPMGPQAGGDEDEIKRLFLEVERNLKRIDELLNDASSGDAPLAGVEDSGLDELLRTTGSESQSVVQGIDQILEIARRRSQSQGQGQGQKSGGQGQKPQGDSPLDQQRDGGPRRDEATPEGVDPQDKPEGQEQPEGQKPKDGEKPDSPEGSDDPGKNAAGRDQTHDQGDPRAGSPGSESWGMLPDKVQEIFRNEGTEDLPVQYRDWIDAYYKRLNAVDR